MKQQAMKKQSGFTLIELVIVIIILGILAATAVPKFVDMQSDARQATMKGVKAALESAATLTYSKVAIDGREGKTATENKNLKPNAYTVDDVTVTYGYPEANKTSLEKAAGLSDADWDITGTGTATIVAEGEPVTGCRVTYKDATETTRPEIKVVDCDA